MGITAPLEDSITSPAADAPAPAVAGVLDRLRIGDRSEEALDGELQSLVESDPERAWELVSLLDQRFRRGEIRPADYRAVNSRLIAALLGSPRVTEQSPEPPATATSPPQDIGPSIPPGTTAEIGASEPVAGSESLIGRTLRDRYRIVREIGRGGLGTVFEAVDQFRVGASEESHVALKILHPAVSRRPPMLNVLVREFRHVQRLTHPNIVRVHEIDRDAELTFFTMELLSGLTIDRVMTARRRTALSRRHAFAIVRDIGSALAHAHASGIVHGDINLHNVFVTGAGSVRVLDFGSSARMTTEPWIDDADSPAPARFATLQFASCELLEGRVAEIRDDLFAFACLAYVLITGRHPFGERTALQARALGIRPHRPRGLARAQWRALRDGLALQRDRRPTDVAQWTRRLIGDSPSLPLPSLEALIHAPRGDWPLRLRRATGIGALLLMAIGAWVFRSTVPRDSVATVPSGPRATPLVAPAPPVPPVAAAAVPVPREAAPPTPRARLASHVAPSAPSGRSAPAVAEAPARVEFATNRVVVSPRDPVARVVVERAGTLRSAVRFRWQIEPGTAHPDKDYSVVGPYDVAMSRGRRRVDLLIPIVFDPMRLRPVNFYVTLAPAGPGLRVGPRTITRVTILPSR